MAYSVAHKEECLRNAINKDIPEGEKQIVANIYVDEYVQKIPSEANFNAIADTLLSMSYLTRYDVFACDPKGSGSCNHSHEGGHHGGNSSSNHSHEGGHHGENLDPWTLGQGMFCQCDKYRNVDPVPVAQGSKNATKFQIALWRCELAALPAPSDKYYTPDGTSDSCVFVLTEDRYGACLQALMGNVTKCGD
jgi:hypothetical protein